MFYMFILMSGSWFVTEIRSVPTAEVNKNVANGEVVAFADSIEGFVDEMNISMDDIQKE